VTSGTPTWERFCGEFVPEMLIEWGTPAGRSAEVGADILERATSFAASGRVARDVFRVPLIEEVSEYEPASASIALRTAVCLIVRCSLLEDEHVAGVIEDGGITRLTSLAVAPLMDYLNAAHVDEGEPAGRFAGLDMAFPRAWTALSHLSDCYPDGGRRGYHADGPVPELPTGDEVLDPSISKAGHVILSGIDPRFDSRLLDLLRGQREDPSVLFVSSLTRLSRDLSKMFGVLKFLLAHGGSVMTSNYWIRPDDVWMRAAPLVQPDTLNPTAALDQTRGLNGSHRKAARDLAARAASTVPPILSTQTD
jgi:hypothetical protein